ncbi:MAG TPA: hypothetical protein VNO55_05060 [Polyangia bacterium]|nr:hypothetical protein [Polyangia bacterium]
MLVAGCQGGATTTPGTTTTPGSPGALHDGAVVTVPLEIPAGSTMTIPAGAQIVAAPGIVITVRGALTVASAGGGAHVHARIASAAPHPDQGQAWSGIVVEGGGRLDADGLDLAGAATALTVNMGSLGARFDNGTITDAQQPFQVAAGTRLDTKHATVVNAGAASNINGELHASYLDYQTSAAVVGGFIMNDPGAVFDATDSTLHGIPSAGNDYVISVASSLIHVAYSTITDAHCAFHFDDVARFEIDHVTAGASSPDDRGGKVVYGAMLYGSGAGPNTISNSNVMSTGFDLDQQNQNGPLTIVNTYARGHVQIMSSAKWLAGDMATAPVSDAKPR